MVFGWGKKKLEENEINVISKEKHILLSDVTDILKEIHSVRDKTIMAEVKTFRNKINSNRETLLISSRILEISESRICFSLGTTLISFSSNFFLPQPNTIYFTIKSQF